MARAARAITIFVLLTLVAAWPGGAHASEPPRVAWTTATTRIDLGPVMTVLEDPSRALGEEDVRRPEVAARFVANGAPTLRRGVTRSAFFLHAVVHNAGAAPVRAALEIDQPMATVDVWAGGAHQHSSIDAPFSARAVRHHDLVFPLTIPAGGALDILVRVETPLATFGLELWDEAAFHRADREEQLAEGLFYGALAVMLLYNAFLLFAVRDRSHLYYVAYLAAFTLFYAAFDGYAFQYLWPGCPRWNQGSVDVLVFVATLAFVAFVRAFVDARAHAPRLDRALAWTARAIALAAALALARPPGSEAALTAMANGLPLAASLLAGACGVRAHFAGSPSARFFLVGFGFFFGGLALIVLGNVGILPHGVLTQRGVQFGAVAEVATFALGLANRLNVLRSELASRVGALEEQKRAIDGLNLELRHQVAERSQKLQEAVARLEAARSTPAALAPGQVVEERYEVERRVGAGAMGAVYAVRRLSDGQRLALKVMAGSPTPVSMLRFAREAQLASEIAHPNVVAVVDVGVAAAGFLFLVMELVDGDSLQDLRARYRDLPWALGILGGVARGLEAIHARGVVHRDLKPANVLVARAPGGFVAKISDFGVSTGLAGDAPLASEGRSDAPGPASIARDAETLAEGANDSAPPASARPGPSSQSTLTATGAVVGTPVYMAPELAQGAREARPSADVFGFGVVAFEILTGARPFASSPAVARVMGSVLPPARSFGEACPGLPGELAALLDRCLAFDPDARPSASELVRALAPT